MKNIIKYVALALISIYFLLYLMVNLVIGMESKHPIFPYIDTQLAPNFKIEDWGKVKVGMTVDEVQSAVGKPLSSHSGRVTFYAPLNSCFEIHYSEDGKWEWGDFAWRSFDVYFGEANTVIATSSEWWEN